MPTIASQPIVNPSLQLFAPAHVCEREQEKEYCRRQENQIEHRSSTVVIFVCFSEIFRRRAINSLRFWAS